MLEEHDMLMEGQGSGMDEQMAGSPGPREASYRTGMLLVCLVFLLLYLPFINKAIHIDDPAFINFSRMIGWNPFHAIPADYDFEGRVYAQYLPYEMSHPLLIPYIIKIVVALFGEHEMALHLAFMIFPLIALFSLLKLNAVFFPGSRRSSIILALFFCSIPAFFVNAQNIMTDVPTLAFLLLAMAGFFDGFENGSPLMTWLGGVSLTLAIFCSYQMLAFVPLLFVYALWRRKLTRHAALSIALPLFCLAGWLLTVYSIYDVFPVLKSKVSGTSGDVADIIRRGHGTRTILRKTSSIFAFIGSAMIWVIPSHYVLKRSVGRFFLFFMALLPVSYLATFKLTGYPFATNLFFSVFVALGVLTVITLIWHVWQRTRQSGQGGQAKREIFLLAWVLCVIGYAIALLPFSAARYLLPLFPPALMLLMNDTAWSLTTRARRTGISCVLCGALLFALASAYSDYEYAGTYRNIGNEVKAFRARNNDSFNVWYIGEWGMHYYMNKAGARYLHADSNEPVPGDLVVIPMMPRLWAPSLQVQQRMVLWTQVKYGSWLPLRLFNNRSNAGFYCNGWGMLPFAFGTEPDEAFQVYKIIG